MPAAPHADAPAPQMVPTLRSRSSMAGIARDIRIRTLAKDALMDDCDKPNGGEPDGGRVEMYKFRSMYGAAPRYWYDSQAVVKVDDEEGFKSASCAKINALAMKAERYLLASGIPPSHPAGFRGNFNAYYWSTHRGSTAHPRVSRYCIDHPVEMKDTREILEPVRSMIDNIFKRQFPRVYMRYAYAAKFVNDHPRTPDKESAPSIMFFPFASFCVNTGVHNVICKPHRDSQNLAYGLCVVIPFGTFTDGARLVIEELGMEFEVLAGMPIFFPSALYTHYNTALVGLGMRGSIVAWTGASIFQWVELGGKAVSELNEGEKSHYAASADERYSAGFSFFPKL
ncbi:hypothetical protein PLICRDRAFT_30502 [Plicaturopsis crispa FD-325 SS-3]|nr:hypothetical protein PLICRDRAFT_30502 [Plicaturopsis crispa FD-325 SS-3]